MCGIAGIVSNHPDSVDRPTLTRMLAQIRHRGPDEEGYFVHGEVGLAQARLSIIDLADGHQPMHTEDQSLSIVFNGEIFNYIELREELIAQGVRFRTKSDTEVILECYRRDGEACVERFNGQWAFAIWDAARHELFVSRDRMGIVPFFYTLQNETLIFASEIKAILAHPSVSRRLDVRALDQLFTFWHTVGDRTMFEGIRELPPGCCLKYRRGELSIARYWRVPFVRHYSMMQADECAVRLRDLLLDATRIRLRSDVPVGAYLSGGLDSTVTTTLMRHIRGAAPATFSIGFDEPELDETKYQDEAAAFLGTEHHRARCANRDIGAIFPQVVWHTEKPVLRTAPAPLMRLSRLVRESGYKVVLTGEGADEFLGGYDIFKEAKIRRFWGADPESKRRPLLLRKLYPYMQRMQSQSDAYLKSFFRVREEDWNNPFFSHLPRWETTRGIKLLFSAGVREALAGHDATADFAAQLPSEFAGWHPFEQAQYLEIAGLMPGYILSSQGDRMIMSHSVEGRYPFLDHRVAEFAGSLPPQLKMKALNEKFLLKAAMGEMIPPSIRNRPKQPYRAPDAVSFFGGGAAAQPYVREMLDPATVARFGVFEPKAIERLAQKAADGRIESTRDNMALVGVLSTQLFMAQFIDSFGRSGADAIH